MRPSLRRRVEDELPAQGWVVRDGTVLCSFEAPQDRRGKARGLLGRDGHEGVMILRTRSIHTFGMRFDLDVAFVTEAGEVCRTAQVHRNRVTLPVLGARWAMEAEPGCFTRWNLTVGDQLEFRPAGDFPCGADG